jgi:hypothetical protein
MDFAYSLSGSSTITRKYQIGEVMATAGVPVLIPTLANTDGVLLASTTGAADMIGVTLDAQATRNTAQQTDNVDPAAMVTVIINPDAVFKATLSGGATSGTVLPTNTNTVASTDGLLTTLGLGTVYDDGYIWGYFGANARILRKVTAVAGTDETLIIPFPNDIAVNDTFLAATFGPAEDAGIQLTTTLEQIDATGDSQAQDNFRCIELEVRDSSEEGNGNSFAYFVSFDHLFRSATTG